MVVGPGLEDPVANHSESTDRPRSKLSRRLQKRNCQRGHGVHLVLALPGSALAAFSQRTGVFQAAHLRDT